MLLKAAYGTELFEMGSDDSLNSEKSMEATGKHRGTGPTGPDRFLREMIKKVVYGLASTHDVRPVGRRSPQKVSSPENYRSY